MSDIRSVSCMLLSNSIILAFNCRRVKLVTINKAFGPVTPKRFQIVLFSYRCLCVRSKFLGGGRGGGWGGGSSERCLWWGGGG